MSKKLKEPKAWLYPRAYIRIEGRFGANTLLIIYPDGSCERQISAALDPEEFFEHAPPCWADNYEQVLSGKDKFAKCKSATAAVKAMRAYKGGAPAIYIGEIR